MSKEIINSEKNLEKKASTLPQNIPKAIPPQKNKNDIENLFLSQKNGELNCIFWIERVNDWLGNRICVLYKWEWRRINKDGGKQNSGQLIKKLTMLEEKLKKYYSI